jgi:GDP-D-mannose dehydratase
MSKERVLVTGSTSFVGSHMIDLLVSNGYEVHGLKRARSQTDFIRNEVIYHVGDITDSRAVDELIQKVKPTKVFHLAAQSFVPLSWEAPNLTMEVNCMGSMNIFEAIRKYAPGCTVVVAGSSEEYGLVFHQECPINESQPLRPRSPYGASKVAMDMMAQVYAASYGLNLIVTRAFNHSVSKWTPILLRNDNSGLIDITYISEIRQAKKNGGYLSGRMEGNTQIWDMRRYPLSVWSGEGWTKLNEISCHPIQDGKLIRVLTRSGSIMATDNHSLIDPTGKPVLTGELQIGSTLKENTQYEGTSIMEIDPEIAWFFGFFVAEGCITTNKVRIDNTRKDLLERCQKTLLRYFGMDSSFASPQYGCERLIVRKPYKLAKTLRELVYATDGNKKVPLVILNAQRESKWAFLQGYNAGDGLQKGYGQAEFKNFKTKSPILACGLTYLLHSVGLGDTCLNIEDRNDGYYSINICSNLEGHENWGEHLKIPDHVVKGLKTLNYTEEVWDLSTSSETFCGGVGSIVAHNTGPRRGEEFVTSKIAKHFAAAKLGIGGSVIVMGNMEAVRDFTDVRDMVLAYLLLSKYGTRGDVYNIGSGVGRSIQDVYRTIERVSGVVGMSVVQNSQYMRPAEVPLLICNSQKTQMVTGWGPIIPFEQTMKDLFDYWMARLQR